MMISHIKGTILVKEKNYIIIGLSSGVGYKIIITEEESSSSSVHKEVAIWTHLAVRENSMDLYGFSKKDDLDFFELLITAQGIGPKSAMNILNTASIPSLKRGIGSGDPELFSKITGIGGKRASKLISELKDKVGDSVSISSEDEDAISALASLGYSEKEARTALSKVSEKDLSKKVKSALRILSGK